MLLKRMIMSYLPLVYQTLKLKPYDAYLLAGVSMEDTTGDYCESSEGASILQNDRQISQQQSTDYLGAVSLVAGRIFTFSVVE